MRDSIVNLEKAINAFNEVLDIVNIENHLILYAKPEANSEKPSQVIEFKLTKIIYYRGLLQNQNFHY
jgi:hypothetical protein